MYLMVFDFVFNRWDLEILPYPARTMVRPLSCAEPSTPIRNSTGIERLSAISQARAYSLSHGLTCVGRTKPILALHGLTQNA
jgi:hypothetical protein